MKTWKKVLLLNTAWIIGIAISIFILPPATPVWLWAMVSVATLVLFNYLFIIRRRELPTGVHKTSPLPAAVGWLGVLIFLFELILRYIHR